MSTPLRTLLIEDSEDDATLILRALEQGGYAPDALRVQDAEGLRSALAKTRWDVVLADHSLPNFSAPAALEILHEAERDIPFIIVSGAIGEEAAVALMKAGAHDYINKDALARLTPAIERECREATNRASHHRDEEALRTERELTDAVFDTTSALIVVLDADERLIRMNKACLAASGCTLVDTLGKHPWEIFNPKGGTAQARDIIKRLRGRPNPISVESEWVLPDGSVRTIAWTHTAIGTPDGPLANIVSTGIDITARRAAEDELRKFNASLTQSVAERTRQLEATKASVRELRKQVQNDYAFEDIISGNHRMQRLFEILPAIAESPSTVLIEGESGTGKEMFARAIHNLSPRRGKPFIAVNCGALPDTLLESELFGYKAGAFTDARKDKPGRFQLAQGGTILLDEIGDISEALQVRLLRVLQERVFEPLGSVQPVAADVRVIAATNRSLSELVQAGKFRTDLFYRVNVVRLELPPLRDRMDDLPLLVEHFIEKLNMRQNRSVPGITPEALAGLMSHSFPGNVRELENYIEHAFILCGSEAIAPEHLGDTLANALTAASGAMPGLDQCTTLEQVEAAFLRNALARNNGNRRRTSEQLGIHRTTLLRRMKTLGLE